MSVSMRNTPQRRRSLGPVSPKRIYRNLSIKLRGGEPCVSEDVDTPRHLTKIADAVRYLSHFKEVEFYEMSRPLACFSSSWDVPLTPDRCCCWFMTRPVLHYQTRPQPLPVISVSSPSNWVNFFFSLWSLYFCCPPSLYPSLPRLLAHTLADLLAHH